MVVMIFLIQSRRQQQHGFHLLSFSPLSLAFYFSPFDLSILLRDNLLRSTSRNVRHLLMARAITLTQSVHCFVASILYELGHPYHTPLPICELSDCLWNWSGAIGTVFKFLPILPFLKRPDINNLTPIICFELPLF